MGNRGYLQVEGASKRFGDVAALRDVCLSVDRGESLALLGPSGCGKTTLLRAVAGLESLDHGTIALDGEALTCAARFKPPERRRMGMVFQDWALFPHLTVARNVAYGLSRRQVAAGQVQEALAMVRLEHLADRRPHELSGGQAQRVALARALAPRPRVVLFDEPFASLDTELRVQVREEVATLLRDLQMTAVFVTHDQEEAFVLGDRVAVMRDGTVEQVGAPREVYAGPANDWVAGFVGEANLLPAEVVGRTARTVIGEVPVTESCRGLRRVLVRPEHVAMTTETEGTRHSAGTDEGWSPRREPGVGAVGVITDVAYYGHDAAYRVELSADRRPTDAAPGPQVLVRAPAAYVHGVGERVCLRYAGPAACCYSPVPGGEGACVAVGGCPQPEPVGALGSLAGAAPGELAPATR